MNKWYLICDGDVQYKTHDDGRIGPKTDNKIDKLNRIIELKKELKDKLNIVIHAGDLLDKGDNIEAFKKFKNEYVKNIENNNLELLLCPGNHDTYIDKFPYCKPVLKYLRKKYNGNYHIDFNKSCCYKLKRNNIYFICCGIYPKNLSWLKKNLPKKNEPVIIYYHYNTAINPYCDWWTANEKNKFYNVIKEHNILLIVNGHYHYSGINEWKNITEVRGSGSKLVLIEFEDTKINNIKLI